MISRDVVADRADEHVFVVAIVVTITRARVVGDKRTCYWVVADDEECVALWTAVGEVWVAECCAIHGEDYECIVGECCDDVFACEVCGVGCCDVVVEVVCEMCDVSSSDIKIKTIRVTSVVGECGDGGSCVR